MLGTCSCADLAASIHGIAGLLLAARHVNASGTPRAPFGTQQSGEMHEVPHGDCSVCVVLHHVRRRARSRGLYNTPALGNKRAVKTTHAAGPTSGSAREAKKERTNNLSRTPQPPVSLQDAAPHALS